jgi:hypothetical protein
MPGRKENGHGVIVTASQSMRICVWVRRDPLDREWPPILQPLRAHLINESVAFKARCRSGRLIQRRCLLPSCLGMRNCERVREN